MLLDIVKQVPIACDENGKLKPWVKGFAIAIDAFIVLFLILFLLQWATSSSGLFAWGGSGEGFANDFQRMYAGGPSVPLMSRRTDPGAETDGYRSPQQPSFDQALAGEQPVKQASFTDADLAASM